MYVPQIRREGCNFYFRSLVLVLLSISVTSSEGVMSKSNLEEFLKLHPSYTTDQKPRICQIYSRSTKKHIQIMSKKVVASGEHGNEFALLEKKSINFGVVTIRGVESRKYLCMSKKGKLQARKKLQDDKSCHFIENITTSYWTSYENQKYKGWYIGFNGKNGKSKKGKRTSENQSSCNFLARDVESHNSIPATVKPAIRRVLSKIIRQCMGKNHGRTRLRRHRLQTEDPLDGDVIDVLQRLPEWAKQPPVNANKDEEDVWILRVKNMIEKLHPGSSVSDSTPISHDLEEMEPNPKKSRNGNGRNNRSKHFSRASPTRVSPTRKLIKGASIPKTPTQRNNGEEVPSILTTIASPSFSKIGNKLLENDDSIDNRANEPNIFSNGRDISKKSSKNKSMEDYSSQTETSRIQSTRSRRKLRLGRASRRKHTATP